MTLELRPYQVEAVDSALIDLNIYRIIGEVLPTGAGKTEIMLQIAARWQEEHSDKSVLILSHLSLLTTQTIQRCKKRFPDLLISKYQGKRVPNPESQIVVSTMQTSRRTTLDDVNELIYNPVGLIIIDECHLMLCDSYQKIMEIFEDAKILGMTATPFKQNRLITSCLDKVSYSVTLDELIDQGYLVPPVLHQIKQEKMEDEERMGQTLAIMDTWCRDKKSIIFMNSIENAKLMRNALVSSRYKCHAITSDLSSKRRDQILQEFNEGKIDVLTTVNVLTAGFDSPLIEAILMPYGTDSTTQYLQRVGRGLRPCPEINKKDCQIYVMGASPRIKKGVYQAFHDEMMGHDKVMRSYDTVIEDVEYNNPERLEAPQCRERYEWSLEVKKLIQQLKRIKLRNLYDLINHKQFPKRFLDQLIALDPKYNQDPNGVKVRPTTAQVTKLLQMGMISDVVDKITKAEASLLISLSVPPEKRDIDKKLNERWVIKSGKHKDKYVWEVPHAYRGIVLKKMPASPVAKQFREYAKWQKEKKVQKS